MEKLSYSRMISKRRVFRKVGRKSLHRMALGLNKPSNISNSSQAATLSLSSSCAPSGFARFWLVRRPIKASTDFNGRIVSSLALIREGGRYTRSRGWKRRKQKRGPCFWLNRGTRLVIGTSSLSMSRNYVKITI